MTDETALREAAEAAEEAILRHKDGRDPTFDCRALDDFLRACDPTEILSLIDTLAAAQAEVARLREALEAIRDERGKCEVCGAPAKGDGAGWVGCDDSNRCTWTNQLPRDIALTALKEPT